MIDVCDEDVKPLNITLYGKTSLYICVVQYYIFSGTLCINSFGLKLVI